MIKIAFFTNENRLLKAFNLEAKRIGVVRETVGIGILITGIWLTKIVLKNSSLFPVLKYVIF